MAKIMVTGGTGFFGRALLRYWMDQAGDHNHYAEVTVLTRSPQDFVASYPEFNNQPWLRFHAGDILEPVSLPLGQAYTHILHAAADSTHGPQLSPLERYNQIVDGTRNLLDFAVVHQIPRFLITSSGGVYGRQPQHMEQIPEDFNGMPDPLNSQNAYSVAKRCAEHLCALYQERHGLQTVVARCFAFIGRDLPLNVHFAIGNFIRDALYRKEITVAGDGTAVRSYLDQGDLAVWLLTLLEKGQSGRAYNVGSDQAITIADLADQVRDLLSPTKVVRILGQAEANSARSIYVPDISRARKELGLDVTIPLTEAILATANSAE